jgi:outer membrane lipoprotein-sorting protein
MKQLICAVLTVLLFLCNESNASEKNKIIENLKKINSLQFNFTQLSSDGQENGNCILIYPKKMRCIYEDQKKEIIIKDDYLYLINKEENKNYNYSIKDTPLGVMLDKESLIEKLSNIEKFNISNNFIIATVDISSTESVDIYFELKNFTILGWRIKNYDKSTLEFMMKNIKVNINSDEEFQIPN